ncbi:MAG: diguanylate cyclase [Nitrospinaceae bacterium]|nr:diguanylate cyclase [Nitrospinaceae bacterium]NIR56500.1 diguanylate cyclase [Nitrospinaceae bacterium]NIS86958.1 diguanylate cyclase [Nitrospinaceae bacterium]NIT83802.1 diguanylate cyclase [Nitrospinaceae bacterium]NIU46008.1 diguanylate cyclase [Nitrospinaceae bacterium]
MSRTTKTYLVYIGLGLIPVFLDFFLPREIDGKTLHALTQFFPYPLYMGFALVAYLCFKINQIRILFSVLMLLGVSFLLFNPLTFQFIGIGIKGIHFVVAMALPLTLAIMFSIRETRPMDIPNFSRLLSSLIPFLVLGYLVARDVGLFSKIAFFKFFPIKGFILPQLALASLAIFGIVIFLQKDRVVKPFVRVLGITMIPLMAALWAGLTLYSNILTSPEIKELANLAKRSAKHREAFQQGLSAEVSSAFPSLSLVAAFTIICAILLHAIFRAYWQRVYIDELTDIPNRRALDERLAMLSGEYAIAMMDIDHFKSFNDTYGHDEGDNVLKLVAGLLSEELGDKVYRYGGEEFCAVFNGLHAEDAYMFVNKVRRKLEERDFYIRKPNSKREHTSAADRKKTKENGKKVQVTISIGIANPGDRATTPEEVLQLADKALYQAKEKGRNCVVMWETEKAKSATRV